VCRALTKVPAREDAFEFPAPFRADTLQTAESAAAKNKKWVGAGVGVAFCTLLGLFF